MVYVFQTNVAYKMQSLLKPAGSVNFFIDGDLINLLEGFDLVERIEVVRCQEI